MMKRPYTRTRDGEGVSGYLDLGVHSYLAYLRDRLVVGQRTACQHGQYLRADRR